MGIAQDDNTLTLRATLRGDNEVPPINTPATGDFKATQNADGTFNFTLTFANLKANLILAHFHFAPKHVAGAVMIFLLGGDSPPTVPPPPSFNITCAVGPTNVFFTRCYSQQPSSTAISALDFVRVPHQDLV